jgi:hypothetical protein
MTPKGWESLAKLESPWETNIPVTKKRVKWTTRSERTSTSRDLTPPIKVIPPVSPFPPNRSPQRSHETRGRLEA